VIILRISALLALLLPVSILASIGTRGDNEMVVAIIYPVGLVGFLVAAISTFVFAARRRSGSPHAWPNRWDTIAAAVCFILPMVLEALGVPSMRGIWILIAVLAGYVAVRLLIAPGSEEKYLTMAERRSSDHVSAADVVDRRALGGRHEAEGSRR
jgi:hypothetical protein